jgi:hypothetical protein
MVVSQPHTLEAGLYVAPLNVDLKHLGDTYLLGAGLCSNHVVIPVMKLNHQDKVARRITTRATIHNMIEELWLHVGVLHHTYTMIQDDLYYRLDLIHKQIKSGGGCHQTKSDAMLGAAIKNNQRLQPLHV